MDKRVALRVVEVAESQEQVGAYALVLGEVDGKRKLPIIIGASEAQATVIFMQGARTPRPLTHDLFATTLMTLGAKLLRVLIYKAQDGVFYTYIYLKHGDEIIRIDARTSDAVALAVRMRAPIMIYESILESECIKSLSDAFSDLEGEENAPQHDSRHYLSLSDLEFELNKAIEEENYEMAACLRDEINKRKNK